MTYNPAIPQAGDDLSDSQPQILSNFAVADTSFGIDHYKFSNLTANNGFHNQMTTPLIVGGVHPATAAAVPKMYAMQDSANLGVINYSRGPSSAVPTPITNLQSASTTFTMVNNTSVNVLDFSGLTRALGSAYAMGVRGGINRNIEFLISYDGTTLTVNQVFPVATSASLFQFIAVGTMLVLSNTTGSTVSDIFWSLRFQRTA